MGRIKKLDWLKEDQREFLKDGYLTDEQTPEERYDEICDTIENYCLKLSQTVESINYSKGIGNRFRHYIEKGWASFSTPVLINFGKKENLPISCNKSTLEDSLDSIYSGIHELGMLAKYGAGTSQNFSKLRPIGSNIETGGTSNTILDWIELYADMMSKTNQNRARRGFLTAYLSVEHPEILDFLDIGTHRLPSDKQRFLQTITTGVTLPMGWLKDLKKDPHKRKIWTKILKTRSEIGYPYILDLENTNNARPQVYKDKNMSIETSNICCVTADTLILTDKGYVRIIDTIGKKTNIWNGEQWSEVVPFKTSEESDIYKVTTNKGNIIEVTDYHKWYVKNEKGTLSKITTLDLKAGDMLIDFNTPEGVVIKHIVESIEKLDTKKATYCFTDTIRGMGVFNGILTGQCETAEYTDEEKTFACCLSSVNAYYFDEWKDDPNFIFDMNLMLDCVIEEYIEKGSKLRGLEKAVRFAKEHRSIGLGILAFASYLQKKKIVFGELASYSINAQIFSKLRDKSEEASKWMAMHWGEPEILKGYGLRNTTRISQAPTKSTSYIMGGVTLNLSEGIEPHKTNIGSKKLAKIQSEFKNKELEELLIEKGENTKEVWESILKKNGSVQHLKFLNDREKQIFRTFSEISQMDVIKLAGQRAKYIDQGQSVNIMIHPDTPPKDINKLHITAFEEGVKSLYYQYSINASQKFSQELLTCSSCEA